VDEISNKCVKAKGNKMGCEIQAVLYTDNRGTQLKKNKRNLSTSGGKKSGQNSSREKNLAHNYRKKKNLF